MRIHVTKDENGTFVLSFDDTIVTLGSKDVKILLLEIMQVFGGGTRGGGGGAEFNHDRLFERIKEADDVSLQTMIQIAQHDDMVALIKLAENDEDMRQKLFRNMSDNSRKIFVEDAAYRFQDASADGEIGIALIRLTQVCDSLRDEGRADI